MSTDSIPTRRPPSPAEAVGLAFDNFEKGFRNLLIDNRNFKSGHAFRTHPNTEDYVKTVLRSHAELLLESLAQLRDVAQAMAADATEIDASASASSDATSNHDAAPVSSIPDGEIITRPFADHYCQQVPSFKHVTEVVTKPDVDDRHADLAARCAEVLHWKRKGILEGEAIKKLADQSPVGIGDLSDGLMWAERKTMREAMEFVIATVDGAK